MTAGRSRCGAGVLAGLAAAIGVGMLVGAAAAQESAEAASWVEDPLLAEFADGPAERTDAGIQVRNVPPFPGITSGCQPLVSPGAAYITGPAYRRADNFKPMANGTINAVSWTGYYRQLTATTGVAAPAGETFEISFRADAAGVPGAVVAGPFVVSPTSTPDGTFGAGGPTINDYVATLPSGVAVTAGACMWLEIRNTTPGNLRWFWHGGALTVGDTVSYVAGGGDTTYNDFEQVAADLAFCLDIELDPVLGGTPCPIATIPSACANPDANGQPRAGATSGFSSNTSGSVTPTGGGSVSFERAEAFRLTSSGNIENVCFFAFWNSFLTGVGGGLPANPDLVVTYYNNDPDTGLLPGSILAQHTVGQPGVTLTFDATGIHRIDHPPVPVLANTCYYISIAYRSDVNDPTRHARFIWGFSNSPASNTDGLVLTRTTNTNPVGAWGFTQTTAPARGLSFLFNVGDSILPCTPPVPTNVSCATATTLALNGPAVSSSNIGIPFSTMPPCQFDLVFGGLAWFTLLGDGNTVTLSTCFPGRLGDPNLNVYCASDCNGPFNCVIGNDDLGAACNTGATAAGVTFPTVAGQRYYVTVHGTGNTATAFTLAATSDNTPANPPAAACATFTRCEISGDASDLSEGEPCVTAQADNTNRTCATAAVYPAFGQTVAGRVSTYLNGTTLTRDFDYWRMPAVAQPTVVTFRLYGEFPVDYLWQSYAVDCNSTPTTLLGAVRLACTNTFIGTVTLQPGVLNTLRISAPDFQGLPCPNFNDYRVTVNLVPQGACCVPATACFVESAANCDTQAGEYQGDNVACEPTDPCTATASGACCAGTTCTVETQANCTGTFTRYAGDNTTCNVPGNFTTPCCKADYNQGGAVTVQDIFDFLADYFSANPRADINGGGTSVQDIFDFLAIYFAGCA